MRLGLHLSLSSVAISVACFVGSEPPVEPTLGVLSLSPSTATAGSLWTATISGKTAGSAITATSSDGTVLSVTGTTVTGTFTAAGSPTVTLTETLAGATNSPRSTSVALTVAAAPVSLNPLVLSTPSASATVPWTSTFSGKTSGSTVTAASSDGAVLTVSGTSVSGTFSTQGSKTVTLTETLSGATNTPRPSPNTVTVAAAPVWVDITDTFTSDTSDPPAGYIRKFAGAGGTLTSTFSGGSWTIDAGSAPTTPNRWVRPLSNAVKDGSTVYRIEIDYQASTASTSGIVRINTDGSGQTGSEYLIPFDAGAGPVNNVTLNKSTLTTLVLEFTIPSTATAPHLQIDGPAVAGRSVTIHEVRIKQAVADIAYKGLAALVGYAEPITAEDLGNPPWLTDKNVLRYAPDVLEGGIRPGVDLNWQGNFILAKINNSATTADLSGSKALDNDLDYDIVGKDAFASTTPITRQFIISGGRRIRIIGFDTGGKVTRMTGMHRLYMEGIRGDYNAAPVYPAPNDLDFIYVGGRGTEAVTDGSGSRQTIQNIMSRNQKSANAAYSAPCALTRPIRMDSVRRVFIDLTSAPTIALEVGRAIIISGTKFGGVTNVLADFNNTWTISHVLSPTSCYAVPDQGTRDMYNPLRPTPPASGTWVAPSSGTWVQMQESDPVKVQTDDTTGAIFVLSGTGFHADGVQHSNESHHHSSETRIHNIRVLTNYCMTILPRTHSALVSNAQHELSIPDPLLYPTDDGGDMLRIGSEALSPPGGLKELINVWGTVRPAWINEAHRQLGPGPGPMYQGQPSGGSFMLPDGAGVAWVRDEFRGGLKLGLMPTALLQQWDDLGFNYVADKTYHGIKTPSLANVTGLTFTGTTAVPPAAAAGTAGGTRLGLLSVQHALGDHPGRFDFSWDPDAHPGNTLHLHGRSIVSTGNAMTLPMTVKVNATLRGSPSITRQVEITFTAGA